MTLFFPRSPSADIYARAHAALYQPHLRVWDPSFALANEPLVFERLQRDAIIAHVMHLRKTSVSNRKWTVKPKGESEKDKLAAKVIEDLIKEIFRFKAAMYNLSDAIFRGTTHGYIEGERRGISVAGLSRSTWWVPRKIKDVDKRRFRIINASETERRPDGTLPLKRQFLSLRTRLWEEVPAPAAWIRHAYQDNEASLGYGHGLVEALYYYSYMKTTILDQGLQGLERWAQGLVRVGVDGVREASTGRPNDEIVNEWMTTLEKVRSQHVLVHDSKDEFSVEQGPGQGWQIVQSMIQYTDNAIRQLVLGGTLPTGGGSGNSGSSSLGAGGVARVQEDTRHELVSYDRELLSDSITRDLIGLLWRLNKSNLFSLGLTDEYKPTFTLSQDPKSNPEASARVATVLLSAGLDLRKDEVYDRTGFTPPRKGDDIIEGRDPNQAGGGGFGSVASLAGIGRGGAGFSSNDYGAIPIGGVNRLQKLPLSFEQGQPCEKGETAAKTGCIPQDDSAPSSQEPSGASVENLKQAIIKGSANIGISSRVSKKRMNKIIRDAGLEPTDESKKLFENVNSQLVLEKINNANVSQAKALGISLDELSERQEQWAQKKEEFKQDKFLNSHEHLETQLTDRQKGLTGDQSGVKPYLVKSSTDIPENDLAFFEFKEIAVNEIISHAESQGLHVSSQQARTLSAYIDIWESEEAMENDEGNSLSIRVSDHSRPGITQDVNIAPGVALPGEKTDYVWTLAEAINEIKKFKSRE